MKGKKKGSKRKKEIPKLKKNIIIKKFTKKKLNLHFSFNMLYWLSFVILSSFFFYKEMYYGVFGCCVVFLGFFVFGNKLLKKKKEKEFKKVKIKKKKERKIVKYKGPLKIIGIICLLLVIYFLYNSRKILLELLNKKEILYYIMGGILIGVIVVLVIKFVKKIRLPKFKKKKFIVNKKPIRITKANIPLKRDETYFDKLVELVNEKGSVDILEVTKKFGITRENAERWGKILEEHGLIKLRYHGLNKISFKKW